MSENKSDWPDDPDECVALARADFIDECAGSARYWLDWGIDRLIYEQPAAPFERPQSAVAKEDRAFREVFATLKPEQRAKVVELFERCVPGAVFSTLCHLDQFPQMDIEIIMRERASGRGFCIAPTETELHDEFHAAFAKLTRSSARRGA